MKPGFYVKHCMAGEMGRPDGPWQIDGPFETYQLADDYWREIRPNWQTGPGVGRSCECGEFVHMCLPKQKKK